MTSFALWICQVSRDLKKLVTTFFYFVLAIVELGPDVFYCDLFLQLHLISGRIMNFLVVTMLVVISENSGCDPFFLFPRIGVATWLFLPLLHFYVVTSIRCRDIIFFVSLFNS